MNKKEMDAYFITIIPTLQGLARGVAYKYSKAIDADAAISEAYIHLTENQDKIQTTSQIEAMMVNYINRSIIWTNSKLSKKEMVSQHNSNIEDPQYDQPDDSDDDIEFKLQLEAWYSEKKGILSVYRSQEKSRVKQIIFDLYFTRGITKGTQLGKHLQINKDYACKYIRELKNDLREYASKTLQIK